MYTCVAVTVVFLTLYSCDSKYKGLRQKYLRVLTSEEPHLTSLKADGEDTSTPDEILSGQCVFCPFNKMQLFRCIKMGSAFVSFSYNIFVYEHCMCLSSDTEKIVCRNYTVIFLIFTPFLNMMSGHSFIVCTGDDDDDDKPLVL